SARVHGLTSSPLAAETNVRWAGPAAILRGEAGPEANEPAARTPPAATSATSANAVTRERERCIGDLLSCLDEAAAVAGSPGTRIYRPRLSPSSPPLQRHPERRHLPLDPPAASPGRGPRRCPVYW